MPPNHVKEERPSLLARCFVAMPFGLKAPAGRSKPKIDFDAIYAVMKEAVETAGVVSHRADFSQEGGFIHKDMYEGLVLANYVIADLSLANANVAYELGLRHGANAGPTLLVAAKVPGDKDSLPFDFRPLRVAYYDLDAAGNLLPAAADALRERIADFFAHARRDDWREDNPLLQLSVRPRSERLQHEKADSFIARVREASSIGDQVVAALDRKPDEAVAVLAKLEQQLHGARDNTFEKLSGLLSVFLAYREKKAYARMSELADKLPPLLATTTVVREQLALALNRLAEATDDVDEAERLRKQAFRHLEAIPAAERTSETFGIKGRIYKASFAAAEKAGDAMRADGLLDSAIEAYDAGLAADPRDYYPGVNAVTLHALRLSRHNDEDRAWLERVVPVVRYAVERLAPPTNDIERYWRTATRVELAAADRDWPAARKETRALLAVPAQDWMRSTTSDNLEILAKAFGDDAQAQSTLDELLTAIRPGSG